jgi:amino acid transporter
VRYRWPPTRPAACTRPWASWSPGATVLAGWLIPPLVLLQLGFTTAATINSEFAGYPANLWWPWSLAGAVIVLAAGYFGVRASARLGTILGISEIAVFLVLAACSGSSCSWPSSTPPSPTPTRA